MGFASWHHLGFQASGMPPVLDQAAVHDAIDLGSYKQQKFIFLQFWRQYIPDQNISMVGFWWSLLLGYRLLYPCIFTWRKESKRALWGFTFLKALIPFIGLCWSFIEPEPGGLESTMSERTMSERRKEANIPWVMQLAFMLQGISQK